jgi:hypothetical protein
MWTSTEKAQRKIDDRGPRFAVFGTVHRGQHYVEYALTGDDAESIRARYENGGYTGIKVHAPIGSGDLAELGRARAEARRDFDEKTSILRAAVLRAVEENRAEAEIAREAGIDRMTVREWSGKRRTRTQQEERSAS